MSLLRKFRNAAKGAKAGWRHGYDVAKAGRLTSKLHGAARPSMSADQFLAAEGPRLVAIGRYLARNHPSAKQSVRYLSTLVVGKQGITPQFRDDDLEMAWWEWSRRCTVRGHSWRKLQSLLIAGRMSAGEAFATRNLIGGEYKIGWFEPEQLWVTGLRGIGPGENMQNGVVYDSFGRPVRYLVAKEVPGWLHSLRWDYDEIEASRVYHVMDQWRLNQWRGESAFAAGAMALYDYRDAQFAELTALRMQAYAGMHYKPDPETVESAPFDPAELGSGSEARELSGRDGRSVFEQTMEPGEMFEYPGEVNLLQSNRPGNGFDQLVERFMYDAAVSVGIPPHVVTGDYSKANYSSLKAADNTAGPTYEDVQQDMIEQFCEPCIRDWADWAIQSGVVQARGRTARTIMADIEWQIPARPFVDELKGHQAMQLAMELGVLTFDQACAMRGLDGRDQRRNLAEKEALDAQFGVKTPGVLWGPEKHQFPDEDEMSESQNVTEDGRALAFNGNGRFHPK